MSAQNIVETYPCTLASKVDEVLVCMGDKFLIQEKYGIGEGYNTEDFKSIKWLYRLLCNQDCLCKCHIGKLREKLNMLTIKYI